MRQVLQTIASLRLTVTVLCASIILVFIGTIAQVDEGLYQAQERFFKQWLVFEPTVFGHRFPFPIPGGYLLGTVLVINLVAAHSLRFTWSWRKWGIHLAHLGIVVLILGQLMTDMLSRETYLSLREGESKRYSEMHRAHELVFHRAAVEDDAFVLLSGEGLSPGRRIVPAGLPFEIRIIDYHVHSEIFTRSEVVETGARVSAALASVEARLATRAGMKAQAEVAQGSRARLDIWRSSLSAVGATDTDDPPGALQRLDADKLEPLRRELIRRLKADMLEAFRRQGDVSRLVADRAERDEPVTGDAWPAATDHGDGARAIVVPLPETRELNARNIPAVTVEVIRDGRSFGTWLLSPWLEAQEIEVDGAAWKAAFRNQRVEHPFEVHLLRTTHEVYRGSDIPRNFQSRIRLHHPGKGETREVDISMNEPLRYEGLTFYQYQMGRDELDDNLGTSIFLVVRNPAWIAPYLGCILVAAGLSGHFLLHLFGFIGKRARRDAGTGAGTGVPESAESKTNPSSESTANQITTGRNNSYFGSIAALRRGWRAPGIRVPVAVAAAATVWLALPVFQPEAGEEGFAIDEFGRLPIVANGRIQPMDSLARNSLLQLRERQTVHVAPWKGRRDRPDVLSATEWLMAMMMAPERANKWPVFRVDHPGVKGLLDLSAGADPDQRTDGKHFAWPAILHRLQDLQREARRAGRLDSAQRDAYEQAVVRLWSNAGLYMRLQNTLQPQNATEWSRELEAFVEDAPAGIRAIVARERGEPYDSALADRVLRDLRRFDIMAELEPPLIVPPPEPPDSGDWSGTVDALVGVARGEGVAPGLTAYAGMADAYRTGDVRAFNRLVRDYRDNLQASVPSDVAKAEREHRFNRLAPFYRALALYLVAFTCICIFWCAPLRWQWMRRSAVALVLVAFAVHTAGLLFRMALEGRPPVTNLYSSAIFVGWGACVLGLVLEGFWRNALGAAVAAVTGSLTLIVAHHLALGGDTMEMMRAVLDSNFWLSTHVVVITLGYASTFVAGFLGILFVLRGVGTRTLDAATARSMARMAYGILCFAILFSFVGTLLGGIWADQSWGRFWGWDPKENGALIIVLWNALILHARWGGLVRERGLMILAICGNIATAWSWFGVNMLGIGLHSYGFMDGGFRWLLLFAAGQLAVAALGLLPVRYWRSGAGEKPGSRL